MHPADLLQNYPIITNQVDRKELEIILTELQRIITSETAGDIVEFGCYQGTTSLFLQRMLGGSKPARTLHVYDSFVGLPDKKSKDNSPVGMQFQTGALRATKQEFITNFKKARLPLPVVHKGWFKDLVPSDVPPLIAFAFLDGDYYESVLTSLHLIETKLSSGAVIVVDDYHSEALPGAQKAVDEWLSNRKVSLQITHSLAIIRT